MYMYCEGKVCMWRSTSYHYSKATHLFSSFLFGFGFLLQGLTVQDLAVLELTV